MAGNIAKILNLKESKNDRNPFQSVAILRNRFAALLTSGITTDPTQEMRAVGERGRDELTYSSFFWVV